MPSSRNLYFNQKLLVSLSLSGNQTILKLPEGCQLLVNRPFIKGTVLMLTKMLGIERQQIRVHDIITRVLGNQDKFQQIRVWPLDLEIE